MNQQTASLLCKLLCVPLLDQSQLLFVHTSQFIGIFDDLNNFILLDVALSALLILLATFCLLLTFSLDCITNFCLLVLNLPEIRFELHFLFPFRVQRLDFDNTAATENEVIKM